MSFFDKLRDAARTVSKAADTVDSVRRRMGLTSQDDDDDTWLGSMADARRESRMRKMLDTDDDDDESSGGGLLDGILGAAQLFTGGASASDDDEWFGMSFSEWNRQWECIGPLKTADLSPYNHCVGLYMHKVGGRVMYVGRAIELYNGGFRKRLSDYRRDSNSARKHTSGRTINEHLDEITTYVLVVGDTPEAVEATKAMEPVFIRHYAPPWNKMFN